METDMLNNMILQAPNFVGFIFAILILNRVISMQEKRIDTLIAQWEKCEDDRERRTAQVASNK